MMSKQEALSSRLVDLNTMDGVRGSAFVSRDGLPLVTVLPHGVNQETFAAMVATTVGAAESAAAELDPTTAQSVVVTLQHTRLVIVDAGPELVLAACTEARTEPQPVVERLLAVARDVQEIL